MEINQDTKQRIFECSKALFYRNGYKETTMRQIAIQAGVSLGLPIYHFESKENLGVEIYKEVREKSSRICDKIYPYPKYKDEGNFLNTVIDFMLLIENINYRRFYIEIAFCDSMREFMSSSLHRYKSSYHNKWDYLNSLTVPAVKAIILKSGTGHQGVSNEELGLFLFERYLIFQRPDLSDKSEMLFNRFHSEYKEMEIKIMGNFEVFYND